MNLTYKIGSGIAAAALITSLFTTVAFANTVAEISGNGSGSINKIKVTNNNSTTVTQTNTSIVVTEVVSSAHTGSNEANNNTGGTTSIYTGAATSDVAVTVYGGTNTASVSPCGCQREGVDSALIFGNGSDSKNTIKLKNSNTTSVGQSNSLSVGTEVYSKAKTGKNKANGNTGAGAGITTGDSLSIVGVTVHPVSNTLNP